MKPVNATHLTLKNSTFFPHCIFLCCIGFSEQTAVITLNSVKLLVFVMEYPCVYCEGGHEFIYIISITLMLQRANVISTVSHYLPSVVCRCCCSQVLQFCALCRVCQSTSYLRKREILMLDGSVVGNCNAWVWRRTAGHAAAVAVRTCSPQTPHHLPTAHLHSKVHQLGQNVKSLF